MRAKIPANGATRKCRSVPDTGGGCPIPDLTGDSCQLLSPWCEFDVLLCCLPFSAHPATTAADTGTTLTLTTTAIASSSTTSESQATTVPPPQVRWIEISGGDFVVTRTGEVFIPVG